jgi:endonuclease/exonuclease/phosphatase family metal-dependent hydrolase
MRIATFNAENLFARYRFRAGVNPAATDGFTVNELAFENLSDSDKQRLTALAIREVNADILCLQEADSLNALDHFNSQYLGGLRYDHRILVDSHDLRHIDVAVLSRKPIAGIRTHRHERNEKRTDWKFSRDCLEVDVEADGKLLTLYVNHFKSMSGGRDNTRAKREEQAKRVSKLIDDRFTGLGFNANFIVLGDLNDYIDNKSALRVLVEHVGMENVLNRLPQKERWTHYYKGENEYKQLDYLLLSKGLAHKNHGTPAVMRMGLPYRAGEYDGPRFEGVGYDNPKSSDHAPLYMDIDLV